ncbi:MAG TPA: hypothetical protein VGJ84_10145 [Polyangiaceae bacterium]|jgi:hypothetical protein
MAKEARKHRRQVERQADTGKKKLGRGPSLETQVPEIPDLAGKEQLKALGIRLGIPLFAIWVIGLFIFGFTYSSTGKAIALSIPAVITLAALALLVWASRQAKKARGVASILREAQGAADRKAALEKLETSFKKTDPAAVFARAQLELQEDPRKALATLEQIDLNKVMAPIADEARAQRALIHLMLGEVAPARQLADNVDLKRHQEPRNRAMIASVVAEAWARSGQPKKAKEMLALFDAEDTAYAQLRPQLYRAAAYAHAHTNDYGAMKRALRKLLEQDVRLLAGFTVKKTHPMLQKEAQKMILQSGQMPRKMIVQRRI